MASRTLAEYRSHLQHALGGGTPASQLAQDTIINDAGRHLIAMRDWNFLERPSTALNFTGSQSYIALPTDFRKAVDIVPDDGADRIFKWATHQEITEKRQYDITTEFCTYGAIVQPTQTNQTTAMGAPRLEIWPTPSASLTGALHLTYLADWVELTDATHRPNIHVWCESLFIACIDAFAQGYEERDQASVSARLGEIELGPVYAAAVKRDAAQQPSYGTIRGGHLRRGEYPITWNPVTVS